MDASLDFAADVPWFLAYAAEPFELLRVIHPTLNISTLPPPANPIRLVRRLDKRSTCDTTSNGNGSGNGNGNSSSSKTGVLVGAVVGSIVGTLLIAVLAFWLYRRNQRKKEEQNLNLNNNSNNPNLLKEDPPAPMPFPAAGNQVGGGTPPPGMKPMSFYDVPGLNYTPVVYPGAPSTIGSGPSSTYGGQAEGSYYNYAPPPPSSTEPTISSSSGVGYYGSTPAPPFIGHPSSTPSPPPSSITGVYQPWAVPAGTMSGLEAGGSSDAPSGAFATAHEEKAHYSRWQQYPSTAGPGSGSGANSEKAGQSGMAKFSAGPSVVHASATSASGPSGREGAISPDLGIPGREGALSPGLPPPAYST